MVLGSWRPVDLAGAGRLERRVRPQSRARSCMTSRHGRAESLPNRNVLGLEPFEAVDIDTEVVGRDALAVERIDAADLAEEVLGGTSMELVLS